MRHVAVVEFVMLVAVRVVVGLGLGAYGVEVDNLGRARGAAAVGGRRLHLYLAYMHVFIQ